MSTLANKALIPYRVLLRAVGVTPSLPLSIQLQQLILVSPQDFSLSAWKKRYFPHINFAHFKLSDITRFMLQLLWLTLITPAHARAPLQKAFFVRLIKAGFSRVSSSTSYFQQLKFWMVSHHPVLTHQFDVLSHHRIWQRDWINIPTYVLTFILMGLCITTPFSTAAQIAFVGTLWLLALMIRAVPGPVSSLLLMVLSMTASSRYLWWRMGYTLNWDQALDLFWGIVLILAEIYTWVSLLLGYLQNAWPLKRPPFPLPEKLQSWPEVDIFIPSYNEPLSVVKSSVFAALQLDWPSEKLHVYILDDGRREDFRAFAEKVKVGYITRTDNAHAKAGNLNHALKKTGGEYIAIFDCDHIPTRSFLQTTMGWFLRNPKLALIQTPHHFFSPDPFERNLGMFRSIPNEGELFYGLIQDCNDLWNATFFCGSCAVIRRAPLEEIGGIAVETVTEDAHTALRLQRRGYDTAYLNLPQAAGLATESLAQHIGQRIRWARGMAQIFRIDNPFFGKGLTFMQRVCYSNAMLSFFNGAPRLIFLTAPLAFLLFHAYVIYAPAFSVAIYVLPSMVHAYITSSKVQGKFRHSFWADVYDTVLAWYIVRPTTVALIAPEHGKFGVTAKGGLVDQSYFDWGISKPYLFLILLNTVGFLVGLYRLFWGPSHEIPTTLLNLAWAFYNTLLLGAALAVAAEAKQVRKTHRVTLHLPAILHLPDGRLMRCHTEDFSEGGAALVLPTLPELAQHDKIKVTLWRGQQECVFPAEVTFVAKPQVRLRWALENLEQEITLLQCTFARADAWVSWADERQEDQPLDGLRHVLSTGIRGYLRLIEQFSTSNPELVARTARVSQWTKSLMPRSPEPAR